MKIKGDTVHLDGNHPLAGKELRFAIKVTGRARREQGRDRASPRARRAWAPPLTPGPAIVLRIGRAFRPRAFMTRRASPYQ
jgi:hypothetical protein